MADDNEQIDSESSHEAYDSHQEAEELLAGSRNKILQQFDQKLKNIQGTLDSVSEGLQNLKDAQDAQSAQNVQNGQGSPQASSGAHAGGQQVQDQLHQDVESYGVSPSQAADTAQKAASKVDDIVQSNDSAATDEEIAGAIRDIPPEHATELQDYADAVRDAVRDVVLGPDGSRSKDTSLLDELRDLIAKAGQGEPTPTGSPAPAPAPAQLGPPATASSEVMRDVSHLTTLLLGSSPAFAEAMRLQSDALAHSLASLNKVGDMQRQDALGLAITARAAASKLEHQ
ncbi:MAG: hypothetical protein AAGF11_12715 [Myxococcota bacterium]